MHTLCSCVYDQLLGIYLFLCVYNTYQNPFLITKQAKFVVDQFDSEVKPAEKRWYKRSVGSAVYVIIAQFIELSFSFVQ